MGNKILIAIEITEREFLVYLLLKTYLEMEGFEVLLSYYTDIRKDIKRFDPDLVIGNVTRKASDYYPYFYFYGNKKFKILNMYFEQRLPLSEREMTQVRAPFDRYFINKWIVYSGKLKDLLRRDGVPEERICITGHYRHALVNIINNFLPKDILQKHLLGDRAGYNKVVLVCTSFPGMYSTDSYVKNLERELGLYWFRDYVKWSGSMRDCYVQAIERLSKRYNEVLFVVRPHPAKNPLYSNYYREKFKNLKNVLVKREGNISFWVNIADLIVGNRTGALIDAYLADIPAVGLQEKTIFSEKTLSYGSLYNSLIPKYSIDDLEDVLPQLLSNRRRNIESARISGFLEDYGIDGAEEVYFRLCSCIKRTIEEDAVKKPHNLFEDIYWFCWRHRHRFNLLKLAKRVARKILYIKSSVPGHREQNTCIVELEYELIKRIKGRKEDSAPSKI